MAERVEEAAQRANVADLGRVPVLGELVLDVAAVLDDVRTVLGERPRDVLEQPRTIPRVDGDLDAEALRRGAVPLHRREALRVAAQRLHVRAVAAVDRDPLAERDVADDVVAGNGRAALCQPYEDVSGALHPDAEVVRADGAPRLRRLQRDRLLLDDFLRLQTLQQLLDDGARLQLP